MAVSEHDHDMTRRYLLGQLTDDEEQRFEERLLSEDDFFQEVELTKDELAQEYASGELAAKERKWLQENFLASSEGKQRHEFAKTFDHYVRNHRAQRQKSTSLIEWLRELWNDHPQFLRAATTAVVLLIAGGLLWPIIRPSAPRSVATLIVTNSSSTRSAVSEPIQRIRLREHVLRLTLMLPQASSPGSDYRVELSNDNNNVTQTFDTRAQDAQSISVEIPASQLPRGQYAATVSRINANRNPQRIPDNYKFIVE